MPHGQTVSRLCIKDNPPDPAPPFSGKWNRNNMEGSYLDRVAYLLNEIKNGLIL